MGDEISNAAAGLPIDAVLPQLRRSLAAGHVVLCAPPGSGKTTRVPLALLDEPWLAGRRVLLLEPRRAAARLAARYMAAALGEAPGGTVGYQVRFERVVGPATRVEVLTEGMLTRRLQSDPELQGVGLVIFDEHHERNLQADLALALSLDVAHGLRPDLRLLVMSATLDAESLAASVGADAVVGEGRSHPVATHYLDKPLGDRDRLAAIPGLVIRALAEQPGDVLVFLPGRAEIARVADALHGRVDAGVVVLALHGDLSAAEQDRVLQPAQAGPRRVVLSTDLAETSVTIPGIGAVVDAGLARKPRFDPGNGLTRLETRRIARDSATQRAGRAGRLGPGHCYRAWTEAEHGRLAAASDPEIRHADLASVVLELATWGVHDPGGLPWLERPPTANWSQAVALLQDLDALDAQGRATPLGRDLAGVPVHPRLAHLLQVSQCPAGADLAADVAALLSERDPRRGDRRAAPDLDLATRLEALAAWRRGDTVPREFDPRALRNLDRAARQLRRHLPAAGADGVPLSVGALVSLAFPDRIAQRRPGGQGRFLLASGREARVDEADPLAAAEYLVIPALDAGRREGRAWLAAALTREELQALHGARLRTQTHLLWNDARQAVVARRESRFGALVTDAAVVPVADPGAAAAVLLEALRAAGLTALPWTDGARQLQARVATLRRCGAPGDWPDFSDPWLLAHLDEWLAPWLSGITSFKALQKLDLLVVLSGRLDWPQRQQLEQQAPSHWSSPAGTRRRLEYRLEGPPVLAVPLQELFGLQQTPTVGGASQPVVLHLLSPARRPLQITQDLAHFWQNGYAEVRKEMRGRYPKHHWPEDPTIAAPARSGRRSRES